MNEQKEIIFKLTHFRKEKEKSDIHVRISSLNFINRNRERESDQVKKKTK
jgi:hypothetical protein